jgi:GNAT superfamily N-acetyltransferase
VRCVETIKFLEMTDPGQLIPARTPAQMPRLDRVAAPYPELNRFLYTTVGADWYWCDRLGWTFADWQSYLSRPGHETWLAYLSGTPAGYFELDGLAGGDVEVAMFGVMPQFVGQGLGGHLLTYALRQAWAKPASRVWLHTCNNDHPHALANYLARGLRHFKTERHEKDLPPQTPGPWPGAQRPSSREPTLGPAPPWE